MSDPLDRDQIFMQAAIEQARNAEIQGEVPVGAVVVFKDEIIAASGNRNLTDYDPTAHAEIIALRAAGRRIGNHRLIACEVFVTIEPCAMCAGAMVHARLQRLVYGANDPKAGAVLSVLGVLNHPSLNHRMEVTGGVLARDCAALVQNFFRKKRIPSD
jgi:tRNA(adenine34) deaminase